MEQWKQIIDATAGYEVSNHGRIRSLHTDRILSQVKSSKYAGYRCGIKKLNGKFTSAQVHTIVWDHWGDKPRIKWQTTVTHKDGNQANNAIYNLILKPNKNKPLHPKPPKVKKKIGRPRVRPIITKSKKKHHHYIQENGLQFEVILSKGKGKITDKLLRMFLKLSNRTILRLKYSDEEVKKDCQQSGLMALVVNYKGFDEDKYEKALPYFTEIFKRAVAEQFNMQRQYKPSLNYNPKYMSLTPITTL